MLFQWRLSRGNFQNPKAEIRSPKEIRMKEKSEGCLRASTVRTSDFFRASDFGLRAFFRPSDFPLIPRSDTPWHPDPNKVRSVDICLAHSSFGRGGRARLDIEV